jgi:hypothetical protein
LRLADLEQRSRSLWLIASSLEHVLFDPTF